MVTKLKKVLQKNELKIKKKPKKGSKLKKVLQKNTVKFGKGKPVITITNRRVIKRKRT